jgi:hypothetical protein
LVPSVTVIIEPITEAVAEAATEAPAAGGAQPTA